MTINKILDKLKLTLFFDNYENRLTKITYPGGSTSRYIYDGAGKRVQAIENGKVTRYLYDGLNVIIERDGFYTTKATYTRGLSYGGGIGSIISVARQLERKKQSIIFKKQEIYKTNER